MKWKPRNPGRFFLRAAALLMMLTAGALLVTGAYYNRQINRARADTPALMAEALQRHGKTLARADFTSRQTAILLAVEDPAFLRHRGVDLKTPGAGMTTITQGLVKLLYFPEGFKQGVAKIRQTLIAQYALDEMTSKEAQLELFLNIAYFGHEQGQPVHGFAKAAQVYFQKDFKTLTEEEFIALVATLKAPNACKPRSQENTARVQRIRAYLEGRYVPQDLMDLEYSGQMEPVSVSAAALMTLLRLITDAEPGGL